MASLLLHGSLFDIEQMQPWHLCSMDCGSAAATLACHRMPDLPVHTPPAHPPPAVASGRLSYSGVITLLSLYGSYVMVVAVADFTKRMGVEWAELAARLHRCVASSVRRRLRQPLLDESDGEVGGEELQEGGGSRPSYLSSRPGSGVDGVAPSVWLVNGRRQPRHYRQQQRLQQQQLAEQQRQQQLQQQAEQLSDVSDTDEPAPRPSLGQPPRRALRKGSPRSDESRMSAMEIASSAADSPVVEVRRAVVQFAEEATFIPNRCVWNAVVCDVPASGAGSVCGRSCRLQFSADLVSLLPCKPPARQWHTLRG